MMRLATLEELFPDHVAGFWGQEAGTLEHDVRIIRNGDVQTDGSVRWDQLPTRAVSSKELAKSSVHAGDLLLTTSGNCARVAFVDRDNDDVCASNFTRRLRADPALADPRYLFHLMRGDQFRGLCAPYIRGTTLENLSVKDAFSAVQLPIPAIAEQRRIASILDAADILRAKRRQALEVIDTLTRSMFVEMFGDPLDSGRGASVRTSITSLGELARVRTGKLDANAASESGTYPFFTCGEETLRIDTSAFDTKATLVAGNGTLNVKYYEGKFNAYQRTYVIESLDESTLHPRFLHGFLDIYVGRLRQQAIGGVIKYIKLGMLTEAEVPLPSIDNQLEFVRGVETVNGIRLRISHSLAHLESLHSSLVHRSYRGEL